MMYGVGGEVCLGSTGFETLFKTSFKAVYTYVFFISFEKVLCFGK